MKLPFDEKEYISRLKQVKESMDRSGIRVLIVNHPANMNYLTGYDGWSFYVPQGVIVFIDKDEPVWYGREQDSNGARLTTWLSEENIYGYQDDYVQSLVKHPISFAVEIINEIEAKPHKIGVEMDSYYFNPRSYKLLCKEIDNAEVVDATRLVPLVRQIKSDTELEYMKDAARIVENVMDKAIKNIKPGIREGDAAAEVYRAQIKGTDEFT